MRRGTTAAAMLAGVLVIAAPVSGAGQQPPGDRPGQTKPDSPSNPPAAEPAKPEPGDQKPATEPNPNALTKSQYGGGFRLSTEDGRFSMRISVGAQFRYTYLAYDDRVNGNEENYSSFFMRRARLTLDGHAYNPRFTYSFQVQLEPQSAIHLHDAWIQYALKPMLQVGLGRNKVSYGLEFLNSGLGNNMIDRSIFSGESDIASGGGLSRWPGGGVENFPSSGEDANTGYPIGGLNLFRSQGVQLSGRNGTRKVFEYQAGIWQGRNMRAVINPDAGHLVTIRAGYHPNGWITSQSAGDPEMTSNFRTAFIASAYRDDSHRKINAAGVTVPLYATTDIGYNLAFMARYRGFSADVEWGTESYEIDDSTLTGANEFERGGWRAQLGYFVKPKVVEVVGRYAQVERLTNATADSARNSGLGLASVRNAEGGLQSVLEGQLGEMTFGVNYYLSGAAHQHKVFVDYSRLTRQFVGFVAGETVSGAVPDQQDDRVRAMIQFKF